MQMITGSLSVAGCSDSPIWYSRHGQSEEEPTAVITLEEVEETSEEVKEATMWSLDLFVDDI
jgi:hypothetical protein